MFTVEVDGKQIAQVNTALEARKAVGAYVKENWKPINVKKDGKLAVVFKPSWTEYKK